MLQFVYKAIYEAAHGTATAWVTTVATGSATITDDLLVVIIVVTETFPNCVFFVMSDAEIKALKLWIRI